MPPLQFCAKMLENRGVKIIRVTGNKLDVSFDLFPLGQEEKVKLNLKKKEDLELLKKEYLPKVNIVLESFRPGVMERLGLAPDLIHAINPNIIYVRLSAYG